MCGIAGVVRYDRPAQASRDVLAAMRARLAHRGPDGSGEQLVGHAALAHTRLAMVDAAGGTQPFCDGRYTIVYNGELYDHDALRARLPGPWRTRSDTETVLAAYRAWGEACVDRLDGMFAFFVWDAETEGGFAARDRLGIKPFAYTLADGFAFASEAQALAPVLGSARGDREAIIEYLVAAAFSGVARSPFAGVRYLAPGHVLRVSRDGVTARRYWRWQPSDDPAAPGQLRDAFEAAVRASLRADVPLGVFLSGGLDSTAIAAVAKLPAFTITFDGSERWRDSAIVISDDTPYARAAAAELQLALHEVRFDRAELADEVAAVARVDDALPAWEQELSQRALARAASAHVKGVLVGDAADETHYGYHFLLDAGAPATILQRLGSVPIRPRVDPDPIARLDAEYRDVAGEPGVAGTTRLIVERWLPRLLHDGDIQCMAFGLEARVPFGAVGLVDVASRIAPARALAGGVEKAALRDALRGLVPDAIRTRRKSALPKEQASAAIYRAELARLNLHPLVTELVDLDTLARLSDDERGRACRFRVLALHHWAIAHGVS
jgi:asparagine synthase (glutamine-hydrolysing)